MTGYYYNNIPVISFHLFNYAFHSCLCLADTIRQTHTMVGRSCKDDAGIMFCHIFPDSIHPGLMPHFVLRHGAYHPRNDCELGITFKIHDLIQVPPCQIDDFLITFLMDDKVPRPARSEERRVGNDCSPPVIVARRKKDHKTRSPHTTVKPPRRP